MYFMISKLSKFIKISWFNLISTNILKKRKKKSNDDSIWKILLGLGFGFAGITFLSLLSKPKCPVCQNKIDRGISICPICKTQLEWNTK